MTPRDRPLNMQTLLDAILDDDRWDGNQSALAKAIGMTSAALGRARRGIYPISVRNCLLLAQVADRSPREVLTAAKKADLANLIEELYGPPPTVSQAQRTLLQRWSSLTPEARKALSALMDQLLT